MYIHISIWNHFPFPEELSLMFHLFRSADNTFFFSIYMCKTNYISFVFERHTCWVKNSEWTFFSFNILNIFHCFKEKSAVILILVPCSYVTFSERNNSYSFYLVISIDLSMYLVIIYYLKHNFRKTVIVMLSVSFTSISAFHSFSPCEQDAHPLLPGVLFGQAFA